MRVFIVLLTVCVVVGACTASGETAATTAVADDTVRVPNESVTSEVRSTLRGVLPEPACHPTNDREDCTLAIVLMDEPIDLAAAERFAADHNAYLNILYRVDPVCVTKDFPTMAGRDLGETASRRTYWEAEARMGRIAVDVSAGLVPPPTMGGFDVVINQRMSDEWRFARMPGVLFDNVGLWIDAAAAAELAADYAVDFPDHWRYTHSEGRGEIAIDRNYNPRSLATSAERDECVGNDG